MNERLGTENISSLLRSLTIPAILGMLSGAILNLADRIFIGRFHPLALTAVGITMPIQILQMAIVLLIGAGSSTLVSIRLGEGKKEEAEDILFLSFKYILILMAAFAAAFLLFLNPLLRLLSVSEAVRPYAEPYILIIVTGGVLGMPGYCLTNLLRSIGKAEITMRAILLSSLLNLLLDPLFIFLFGWGISGAAIATILSQTLLTIYILWYFSSETSLIIRLRFKKTKNEVTLLTSILKQGSPSLYVQILATLLSLFVNRKFVRYGSDLEVASVTIISTIFTFYNLMIYGLVQGNQPICGYNIGLKRYDRVLESLRLSLTYAFLLSTALFLLVQFLPSALVFLFTKDRSLREITTQGMRLYLMMLPLVGLQTIASQYFQSVGRPLTSTLLSLLRYGVIMIPCTLLLAPKLGVRGIYMSNAVSDFIASLIAIACIVLEIKTLRMRSSASKQTDI